MGETCIIDRDEQCFRDCPGCNIKPKCEPDWDLLMELEREEDVINGTL